MSYVLAGIAICCLLTIIWLLKTHLRTRPKPTIIIIMAILIFLITFATTIKTFKDYNEYLEEKRGLIISNVTFAIFLDFSVLIIGGLFLYLANEIYLTDKIEEETLAEAMKTAEEKLKEADEYAKPFTSDREKDSEVQD